MYEKVILNTRVHIYGLNLRNLIATDCCPTFLNLAKQKMKLSPSSVTMGYAHPLSWSLFDNSGMAFPGGACTDARHQQRGRIFNGFFNDTFSFPLSIYHIVLNNSEAVANALAVRAVRIILSWLNGLSPKDRSAPVNAPPTAAFFCTSHNELDSNSQIISTTVASNLENATLVYR